jgi:hypothetical protein
MLSNLPAVNIVHDLLCMCRTMSDDEIFFNPRYEVILEYPFYNLMEKIGGNKFMNIGAWKIVGERL